jgi:anti-anti-sigma regulatory factor
VASVKQSGEPGEFDIPAQHGGGAQFDPAQRFGECTNPDMATPFDELEDCGPVPFPPAGTDRPPSQAAHPGPPQPGAPHGCDPYAHLLPGDHACFVYRHDDDRRNVLLGYLLDGLAAGQRVAYSSAEDPVATRQWLCAQDPQAARALASGRLVLVDPPPRTADLDTRLQYLQLLADEALLDDYPALRLAIEGTLLTDGLWPDQVAPFEAEITRLVEDNRMLVLCLYAAARVPSPWMEEIAAGHEAPPPASGKLRVTVTASPPGVRLAGEFDRDGLAEVAAALAELPPAAQTILLDMRSLTLLDVAAVTELARTAYELEEGREMVLEAPPPMARRILDECWAGTSLPRMAIAAGARGRAALAGTTWTAACASEGRA